MTGPNLSEWALKHRSFTIFLMMVVTVAGLTSYFRLGRNAPPPGDQPIERAVIGNLEDVLVRQRNESGDGRADS